MPLSEAGSGALVVPARVNAAETEKARENVLGNAALLRDACGFRCDSRLCVNNHLWPTKHDERSGVLIGTW